MTLPRSRTPRPAGRATENRSTILSRQSCPNNKSTPTADEKKGRICPRRCTTAITRSHSIPGPISSHLLPSTSSFVVEVLGRSVSMTTTFASDLDQRAHSREQASPPIAGSRGLNSMGPRSLRMTVSFQCVHARSKEWSNPLSVPRMKRFTFICRISRCRLQFLIAPFTGLDNLCPLTGLFGRTEFMRSYPWRRFLPDGQHRSTSHRSSLSLWISGRGDEGSITSGLSFDPSRTSARIRRRHRVRFEIIEKIGITIRFVSYIVDLGPYSQSEHFRIEGVRCVKLSSGPATGKLHGDPASERASEMDSEYWYWGGPGGDRRLPPPGPAPGVCSSAAAHDVDRSGASPADSGGCGLVPDGPASAVRNDEDGPEKALQQLQTRAVAPGPLIQGQDAGRPEPPMPADDSARPQLRPPSPGAGLQRRVGSDRLGRDVLVHRDAALDLDLDLLRWTPECLWSEERTSG